MRHPFDVARYMGGWRWLVRTNAVVLADELATLMGVDPVSGRAGIKTTCLAEAVHPDDRQGFIEKLSQASVSGKDLSLSYRTVASGTLRRVEVHGTCIRTTASGRPAEYLGAVQVYEFGDGDPVSEVAEHLTAAAAAAISLHDKSLSLFINMALVEAASRLAHRERELYQAIPHGLPMN